MADYSTFPFGDFTDAEVFALARESKDIGDHEFVTACMEAVRKRLTKRAADEATGCAHRAPRPIGEHESICDDCGKTLHR